MRRRLTLQNSYSVFEQLRLICAQFKLLDFEAPESGLNPRPSEVTWRFSIDFTMLWTRFLERLFPRTQIPEAKHGFTQLKNHLLSMFSKTDPLLSSNNKERGCKGGNIQSGSSKKLWQYSNTKAVKMRIFNADFIKDTELNLKRKNHTNILKLEHFLFVLYIWIILAALWERNISLFWGLPFVESVVLPF